MLVLCSPWRPRAPHHRSSRLPQLQADQAGAGSARPCLRPLGATDGTCVSMRIADVSYLHILKGRSRIASRRANPTITQAESCTGTRRESDTQAGLAFRDTWGIKRLHRNLVDLFFFFKNQLSVSS